MYHGPEGAWTAPRHVEELFSLPREGEEAKRWRALVPRFEYLLDDLTAEREEALRARSGPPLVRLALLMLRYGRAEQLSWRLEGWKALFAEVHATPEGLEELRAVVNYLLKVGDKAGRESMQRVLDLVAGEQRAEELMKTVAQELHEEGHQKGWQEGIAKGRADGLAKGRADGLAEGRAEGRADGLAKGRADGLAKGRADGLAKARAEDVLRILAARGITLDDKERERILSCTELATLDLWFDRALNATRLSDLLA